MNNVINDGDNVEIYFDDDHGNPRRIFGIVRHFPTDVGDLLHIETGVENVCFNTGSPHFTSMWKIKE